MNKKTSLILLSSLLATSLVLGGCITKENNEKDPDDNGGGSLVRHDSWDNLMSYDYTNVTILNEDSMLEEASYVYVIDEGKYIDYYPIFGEWYHQFFADYNGSNYVYWDYTSEGGQAGWLNYNSEYHVDLTLEHQEFYLPNLLNKIHEEDVEYSAMMNSFYVKDSALNRITNEVFGFAYDHRPFATIAILVESDSNGKDRISKVRAFDTNDENSPYVQLQFGYYGSTRSQWGFPPAPSATTVKDYWTITGKTPKVETYPSSVSIQANSVNENQSVISNESFDLIMEVGDYADISYVVGPENVNMSYLVTWTPDRSDFIDNDGNPTEAYSEQVALIDIKQNFTTGHKYLTAMNPGEVNVYATAEFFQYDENDNATMRKVNSNFLKVKVNEPQGIDDTNAVFKFNFASYEDIYNDQVQGSYSGLYQTRFEAVNVVANNTFRPVSRITGYHASLLNPGYTDAFEESPNLNVLSLTPQKNVNEALEAYVDFDLDDQIVDKIAFNFSLHRQNQLSNGFKTNYKSFKIYTSTDGINWTLASDQTDFVKTELNKDEGLAGMTSHTLKFEFDNPVNFVRISCEAKSFTGSFTLVIDEVTLSSETITHVNQPSAAVSGVFITADSTSVRINNSLTLLGTVTPSNASNKVVYWTSSNTNVASIVRNADGTVTVTGHREGQTTIKVYTNEKDSDNEAYNDTLTITVLGAPTLGSNLVSNSYSNEEKQLYFSFNENGTTLSVTYIQSGMPSMDVLSLTNEVDGAYTFKSENSEVTFFNVSEDGSSFEIAPTSNVRGVGLPHCTLTKVSN